MHYRVRQESRVTRFLDKLDGQIRARLVERLLALGDDPRPPGCIKLKQTRQPEGWSIRVGKYRVLYQIDDNSLVVTVYDVELRDKAYKDRG